MPVDSADSLKYLNSKTVTLLFHSGRFFGTAGIDRKRYDFSCGVSSFVTPRSKVLISAEMRTAGRAGVAYCIYFELAGLLKVPVRRPSLSSFSYKKRSFVLIERHEIICRMQKRIHVYDLSNFGTDC